MELQDNERLQGLEWLWRQRFDNFHRRQSYEWKMVVVLWTPLVLYTGFGLRDSLVAVPQTMAWIVSVTYLLIHMFWQANLRASNESDLTVCRSIQDEMLASCGLVKSEKPVHWYRFFGRAWAHVTYVIVTALLLVGANLMNASFVQRRMTLSSEQTSRVQVLAEKERIKPAVVIDRCLADGHNGKR